MWLLDLWRRQTSSDQWIESLCDLVRKWKPIGWAEEKIEITSGVGPHLERRLRERQAWCAREQFPTRGDKSVRAQSIRGRIALNGLRVPFGASWFPDFRSELLHFPAGKHDDIVDALGLVGATLGQNGRWPAEEEAGVYNYEIFSEPAYRAPDTSWTHYAQSSVKLM